MKKRVVLFLLAFVLGLWELAGLFPNAFAASPGSKIGESLSNQANSYPFQRKGFSACGLFWVFYSDGEKMVYTTSPDGTLWRAPAAIRPARTGFFFSIWFDDSHLHYAYTSQVSGAPLHYRKGKPNGDGTITWSADEQVAVPGKTGVTYLEPVLAADTNGYPWIGYRRIDGADNRFPDIIKAARNDGIWTTAPGFPYELEGWKAAYWVVVPIPLTDGKMAVIYTSSGHYLRSKTWNGSSWKPRAMNPSSNIGISSPSFSAVANGDDVHLVFLSSTILFHTKYSYAANAWGKEERIYLPPGNTAAAPALSIDSKGDLHLFWAGSPKANHIYYQKYSSGKWMNAPQDFIDEGLEKLSSNFVLTSFYQAGSNPSLMYLTKTGKPYSVKFSSLLPSVPKLSIKITSPSDREVIPKMETKVEGEVSHSAGAEVGVAVNGVLASVQEGRFIANRVPLIEGSNQITAMVIDRKGNKAETSIKVEGVKIPGYIKIRTNIESGASPLDVTLNLESSYDLSGAAVQCYGPGEVEWLLTSAKEYRVRMKKDGIYEFKAKIPVNAWGDYLEDSVSVAVIDRDQIEKTLQAKWKEAADAFSSGNIEQALSHFAPAVQYRYRLIFGRMPIRNLQAVFSGIKEIQLEKFTGRIAECEAVRDEGGKEYSYPVTFVLGDDGVWRIMGF